MNKEIVFVVLAAAVTSLVLVAGGEVNNGYTQASNITSSRAASNNTQGTVVGDSAVILLEG